MKRLLPLLLLLACEGPTGTERDAVYLFPDDVLEATAIDEAVQSYFYFDIEHAEYLERDGSEVWQYRLSALQSLYADSAWVEPPDTVGDYSGLLKLLAKTGPDWEYFRFLWDTE